MDNTKAVLWDFALEIQEVAEDLEDEITATPWKRKELLNNAIEEKVTEYAKKFAGERCPDCNDILGEGEELVSNMCRNCNEHR